MSDSSNEPRFVPCSNLCLHRLAAAGPILMAMERRTLFLLVAIMASCGWQALSQTNAVPLSSTNWVMPGPDNRVVNGQTYNIAQSRLWGSPIDLLGGFPGHANNGHPIRYEVVVEQIINDKVLCSVDAVTYWWETYTGVQQDESRDSVKEIVILNYPNSQKLVTGGVLKCRCMRVNNDISPRGVSRAAFDCGIQATNLIPFELSDAYFQQRIEAERQAMIQKIADAKAAALKASQERKQAQTARIVKFNQELADKGDAYGLLRMGELYRDGYGVEKDLAKAREYLKKAADAGSTTAAEELSELNQVGSTNAAPSAPSRITPQP